MRYMMTDHLATATYVRLALIFLTAASVHPSGQEGTAMMWHPVGNVSNCDSQGQAVNSSCRPDDVTPSLALTETSVVHAAATDGTFGNRNESWSQQNTVPGKRRVRFCGVIDEDEAAGIVNTTGRRVRRYSLHGKKWDKTELTWTLRTPSRNVDRLSEGTIRQQMSAAMKVWERASVLKFTEVHKNTPKVDIYIDFLEGNHDDGYIFDGPGGTLAHAFYPGRGIGGDMHFDDAEKFVPHHLVNKYETSSLLVTAAHELGHSLGLRHSDVDDALMAPYYQEYPEDFALPLDDTYGIQALYGRPQDPTTTSFAPPFTPDTPTTPRPQTRPPTRPPGRPPTKPTVRPPTRPTIRPPTRPPVRPPTRPPVRPPTRPPVRPPTRPPVRPTTRPPVVPQPSLCPIEPPSSDVPDTCNTDFDAVTEYRGELFFFKDKFYWRIDRRGRFYDNESPQLIWRRFPGLPRKLDHIDAVYSTQTRSLVFFIGPTYYELRGNLRLKRKGELADLGVNASHLDAAMMWGHNGRVYLFSGDRYWRLGWDGLAEMDYPRDVAVWRGLPRHYSSALTIRSATYFFAGRVYWSFDSLEMRMSDPPLLISPYWLSCPHHNQRDHQLCSADSVSIMVPSSLLHLLSWLAVLWRRISYTNNPLYW
ncbi:stromelysin-3-like [Panulirus ornatus]|uniref:stromelysin-3-like n=1 Tax=Panulirus ornatus TaxID=150431 RepID=UPI003A8A51BB